MTYAEFLEGKIYDLTQQRAELLEALKAARDRMEASAEIIDDVKGECRSVADLYEDLAMPNELYIVLNAINRAEAAE